MPLSPLPFHRSVRSAGRVAAIALAALSMAACLSSTEPPAPDIPSDPATETYAAALGVDISQMTKVSDDLYVQDLVVGSGAEAASGDQLSINYTGWLVNGFRFGGSEGGEPLVVNLGANDIIPGWNAGVVGMKVGGKRRLVIGSRLAYGRYRKGPIPPNSTLVFDVEVVTMQ